MFGKLTHYYGHDLISGCCGLCSVILVRVEWIDSVLPDRTGLCHVSKEMGVTASLHLNHSFICIWVIQDMIGNLTATVCGMGTFMFGEQHFRANFSRVFSYRITLLLFHVLIDCLLTDSEMCDCLNIQTVSHIVDSCPLTKLDGGLQRQHTADEAAVDWLASYGT